MASDMEWTLGVSVAVIGEQVGKLGVWRTHAQLAAN